MRRPSLRRRWCWCAWCGKSQRRWLRAEGSQVRRCVHCGLRFVWTPHARLPWSQRCTMLDVGPELHWRQRQARV